MNPLLRLMRRFSIRMRMLGAIGVVLSLLAMVGVSGWWGLSTLESLATRFGQQAFAQSLVVADLRVALADMQRHEKEMIIQYEKPTEIAVNEGKWYAAASRVGTKLSELHHGPADGGDEVGAAARALRDSMQSYMALAEPVIAQLKISAYDTATVANLRLAKAHEQMDQALAAARRLTALAVASASAVQAEQAQATRHTLWLFVGAVAIAVAIVLPTTLANMHSICRPIEHARASAQAIASGNLATRIQVDGHDEVASLLRAQAGMQASIARIVGDVLAVADGIRTASARIDGGNRDLSQRTEQAASSLEQTASSLHELTGMVHQTAGAASRATDNARTNATAAEQGGQVMAQVVDTMGAIGASSQKINDIIGVIDGIAFQTNILALNAAVEAARAGEAGRGFAVVASEVRSLAQRSAGAAREIKDLILRSEASVRTGADQVQQAGLTMSRVVGNAREVSHLIADITRSATAQSQGIDEINQAVGELDTMTQQNAALVEQSTLATRDLLAQAERLQQVVAVFRLAA
ncbi:MAG: methyl-accepting chemotaxis protein [Burkholderiaceae bacterium]|nr:methyl-accepting chemotaxis protein [Burkholderiaceae bacterium]